MFILIQRNHRQFECEILSAFDQVANLAQSDEGSHLFGLNTIGPSLLLISHHANIASLVILRSINFFFHEHFSTHTSFLFLDINFFQDL